MVGTASTAQSLTGTPDIEVDDVTASTVTSGYIEATANLGVEGKVGVGTTAPLSNIEVQNVGLSSIYVGSTNDNAVIELGRGLPNRDPHQVVSDTVEIVGQLIVTQDLLIL